MPSREPVATEADDRSFTVLDREFTETGDAAVFVEQQHGRLIYVPGLGWFLWDGGRWQRDQVGEALYRTLGVLAEIRARRVRADEDDQGRILQHYQRASSARGRKAVLALAEVDPALRVLVDDLDRDPLLLALPNGWTLDLRADPIQVRKSKPEDRITKVAGVEFNPHATCPRWLEHVKLVTQDDSLLAAFLQRWCGYTLTGLTSEQKFHFLYGEGDNGKNVFVEVLLAILGEYAMRGSTKILDASSRGEHETVIADLAGMRMVFIDEIPNGRINEERLKELTGTKELRARKMRSDTFQFEARFKLWLAGNNKPRIRDTSLGFWRRLHLSPFNAVIPEDQRIKDYAQRLFDAEGSGILNWCIEGLRDYRTIGGLGAPATVTRAGEDYRDEEDEFADFIAERFEAGTELRWYPNKVLHALYTEWCQEVGLKPLPMAALANSWRRAKFVNDTRPHKVWTGWPNPKSTAHRGWFGPAVRNELPVHLRWTFSGEEPRLR